MRTTIIVVGYKGDRWLPGCLETLARASTSRQHLVLVDNLDNDVEALDLSPFDAEVLKTPRPMGFAEANNFALTHARKLEGVVVFLNQDTLSEEGWIDEVLDCLKAAPQLGAVSPLMRTYNGTGWDPDFAGFVRQSGQEGRLEGQGVTSASWFEVDNAPAAALAVRTSVLKSVGPFDPVFGSYYEDLDLCRRIHAVGMNIGVCRTAAIRHFSGSATYNRERELLRMRQIIRNRLLYEMRLSDKPRPAELLKYLIFHFPRRLVRGMLRTPSSQPPAVILKAHWDLLRIGWRVVSQRHDEEAWAAYLAEIGWPDRPHDLKLSGMPATAQG